jgi:CRISPR-associated protein Cas5
VLYGDERMKFDLNFLLQLPDFSARAKLTIDALAPLSIVASLPGKYYRSQREPTPQMLYGLIENAIGWHVSDKERKEIGKKLKNKFGEELEKSGVGFISLLQFHLRFSTSVIPPLLHYDDLWAQNLKGASFIGGSRNYDNRAIKVMNAYREGNVGFGDQSEAKGFSKDPNKIRDFKKGENLHLNVVRPYFPQYYISPTPREYIIPQGEYKFVVETNKMLTKTLAEAFENPAAPLYLGSNDGWIDARWEVI